jgi:hypothetical protein
MTKAPGIPIIEAIRVAEKLTLSETNTISMSSASNDISSSNADRKLSNSKSISSIYSRTINISKNIIFSNDA